MNKLYLTNEDFSRMCHQLCSQIFPHKDTFKWVVGIKRGGIPLSTWLAYVLCKNHAEVAVSLYGDRTEKHDVPPRVWFGPHMDRWIHTPFLLVDDIVDSGETLDLFRELTARDAPKFWIATLHWCEENSPYHKPDFFVEKKLKSEWIIYPWEHE